MHELIINLHMHTTYSDGSGTYADLGRAALKTGIDVLLVTDHNIRVQGVDSFFQEGKKRTLVLACEEIHDQARDPQKNHLLVFGTQQELASFASDPQVLINAVRKDGGLCFLAHPVDPAMPAFGETDISWEAWNVTGYTGLELWNGFSELKTVAKGRLDALFYAFFPVFIPHGPLPKTLNIWDGLLTKQQRVVAVGGSDAHARHMSMGPIHKVIFPYEYHFSSINTHAFIPTPLTGDMHQDRRMVLDSLAAGHCFVGCDIHYPTRGFRFTAQGKDLIRIQGDEIPANGTVTLQAKFPAKANIKLIKDGVCIKTYTHCR
jgi:hypothetical protein